MGALTVSGKNEGKKNTGRKRKKKNEVDSLDQKYEYGILLWSLNVQ